MLDDDDGSLTGGLTVDMTANRATTGEEKTLLPSGLLLEIFDTAEIDHVECRIDGGCDARSQ